MMYTFYLNEGKWFVESETYCLPYSNGYINWAYVERVHNSNQEFMDEFQDYLRMSRKERKRLKMSYCEAQPCKADIQNLDVSLGCISTGWTSVSTIAKTTKKEEEKMAVQTLEMQQKDYLLRRLRDLFYEKENALPETFGLRDGPQPKTPKELIAAIKDGVYVIEDKYLDVKLYHAVHAFDYIRFRDPKKKEDREGFEKAKAALDKAYSAAKDQVMVMDAKEGLAAVQAFEAATFQ